ncbi:MAG TPA: helix-turn-helix domain-containing protein [Solirubrobacteraceae bacterium]
MSQEPDPDRAKRFVWREGDFIRKRQRAPGGRGPRPRVRDRDGPLLELSAARKSCGLTQKQLADRLGIAQAHVSTLENRGDVRLSSILDYLRALEAAEVELVIRFADGKQITLEIPAAGG